MKKTMPMFSTRTLLPAAITALIMIGCSSNDTTTATEVGTDTSAMHTDTMMIDHTGVSTPETAASLSTDTTIMNLDSSKRISRDTAAKVPLK